MGRKARICIIVMLLSIVIIPFIPYPAESVSEPANIIQIAQPMQTAYVAPGQDGIVTFTGQVVMQLPWPEGSEGLIVHLFADADEWYTTAIPPILFSRSENHKSFSVQVYVPIGTSKSYPGQLELGGTWRHLNTTDEGIFYPATAIIVVKQFTLIDLSSPEGFISIEQGNRKTTRLIIKNDGNGEEKVRLEIFNLKELQDDGWEIELERDKITVEENRSDSTSISIKPSKRTDLGIHNITIRAITDQSCVGDEFFSYTLFINVREREFIGITYSAWIAIQWSLITVLVSVVALLVIIKTDLTKKIHSKLSRTRE